MAEPVVSDADREHVKKRMLAWRAKIRAQRETELVAKPKRKPRQCEPGAAIKRHLANQAEKESG